ncbi:hypothetical protein GCM10009765_40780 [Fodinicola feengrottensis]|uniref:Uncharacterized protein n=1 Tax=Fodinicola feengrottensis TaxID=435914 RepID=A0ABN2HG82_9ACTN
MSQFPYVPHDDSRGLIIYIAVAATAAAVFACIGAVAAIYAAYIMFQIASAINVLTGHVG